MTYLLSEEPNHDAAAGRPRPGGRAMSATISLDELREQAEKAKAAYLTELEEKGGVEHVVRTLLENKLEAVIASFLGFERRWGRDWEVDHCNGRAGNSFVGVEVRARAARAAQALVADALETTKLTEQQKATLRKEYRDELMRSCRGLAREMAHKQAADMVGAALAETGPEPKPVFDDQGEQIGMAVYRSGRWVMQAQEG